MTHYGEDTGFRNNVPLSKAHREVNGLRAIDIDLVQWCSRCRQPELFIESTSAKIKQTQVTRIIASHCGSPTLLLRHSFDDRDHEEPVDIYLWHPGSTGPRDKPDETLEGVGWEKLKQVLNWAHAKHECEDN